MCVCVRVDKLVLSWQSMDFFPAPRLLVITFFFLRKGCKFCGVEEDSEWECSPIQCHMFCCLTIPFPHMVLLSLFLIRGK